MNRQKCFYNQRQWQQREFINPQGSVLIMCMIGYAIYPETGNKTQLPQYFFVNNHEGKAL